MLFVKWLRVCVSACECVNAYAREHLQHIEAYPLLIQVDNNKKQKQLQSQRYT